MDELKALADGMQFVPAPLGRFPTEVLRYSKIAESLAFAMSSLSPKDTGLFRRLRWVVAEVEVRRRAAVQDAGGRRCGISTSGLDALFSFDTRPTGSG